MFNINKHPELKSIEDFVEKYLEIKTIRLTKILSKENMRETLNREENNPFAMELPLIHKMAILTPVVANEIKEGMLKYFDKGKILKVYVGNEDDIATIKNSFILDETLVKNKGFLKGEKVQMEGIDFTVYGVFISPDSPFIKNTIFTLKKKK